MTIYDKNFEEGTEDKFNDEFWENLDFVVNAIDNKTDNNKRESVFDD